MTSIGSITDWSVKIFKMNPQDQPETPEALAGIVVLDLPDPEDERGGRYLLVNCQGDPHFFALEGTGVVTELSGIRGIPKHLKEAFKEELEDWKVEVLLSVRIAEDIYRVTKP